MRCWRGAPQRVKHALRRWFNFHQRVLAKQVHKGSRPAGRVSYRTVVDPFRSLIRLGSV